MSLTIIKGHCYCSIVFINTICPQNPLTAKIALRDHFISLFSRQLEVGTCPCHRVSLIMLARLAIMKIYCPPLCIKPIHALSEDSPTAFNRAYVRVRKYRITGRMNQQHLHGTHSLCMRDLFCTNPWLVLTLGKVCICLDSHVFANRDTDVILLLLFGGNTKARSHCI